MPPSALERKLDILSRASNAPKLVVDALYLIVAEMDERSKENAKLQLRVSELEANMSDPGRDIQRTLQVIREQVQHLRHDAQQLEHSIREAEASFSAQYDIKRAQLRDSLQALHGESRKLLEVDLPQTVSDHVAQLASTAKQIRDAAVAASATAIKNMKKEFMDEVETAVRHTCTSSLDQLAEECSVAVFSASQKIEADVRSGRDVLQETLKGCSGILQNHTAECSAFIAGEVADLVRFTPLEEVHRLHGEMELCQAQVNFLTDSTHQHVAALGRTIDRVAAVTEATVAAQDGTIADIQRIARDAARSINGFLWLWDADTEVVSELSTLQGASLQSPNQRILAMKTEYLLSLPAFQRLASFVSTTPPKRQEHVASSPAPQSHRKAEPVRNAIALARSSKQLIHDVGEPADVEPRDHNAAVPSEASSIANHSAHYGSSDSIMDTSRTLINGAMNLTKRMEDHSDPTDMLSHDVSSGHPQTPLGLLVTNEDPLYGGVIVSGVVQDSLAERSGMFTGDHILSLNGVLISDRDHMGMILRDAGPSGALRFHIERPGSQKVRVVEIVRR